MKAGNAASATRIFLGGNTEKPNGYAVAFVVPVLGVIVVAAVGDVAVDPAVAVDLDVVAVGASVADAVACGMAADPIDDVDYDKKMSINNDIFYSLARCPIAWEPCSALPNAKRNKADHGGNRRKAARAKRGG